MPWVARQYTCVAPRAMSASAAFASVPPVEIISSTTTATLPRTSPTISVTSETSGSGRLLKTIASVLRRRFAIFAARGTPPASGDTTTTLSPSSFCCLRYVHRLGAASRLSTGRSKKPWICAACKSTVTTRRAPRSDALVSFELLLLEIRAQARRRFQVVDGKIEEALDLRGVQIDGHDAARACGRDHVRDQLCGDRLPAFRLLVLL